MTMDWNTQIAARTLWMEARGEPEDGQHAVAHVLVNRLRDGRWGATLAAVCLYPFAFSSWNTHDPNRAAMARVPDDDPLLVRLAGYVTDALSGIADPTRGATHYYAASLHAAPTWVQGAAYCGEFGTQLFYKNVK